MNFLIRTDASSKIGIGHLMRCIALGQILQDDNHNVCFLTQTINKYLLDRLRKENFNVRKLIRNINIFEDAKKTTEYAKKINADWVVTDGYKFETDYQKIIKDAGLKLMCIDDIAECHYVSDIVLNQNMNAEKVFNYSYESYTKLLLGIKYVLLRREFRNLRGWEREIKKNCENILITMGGSDSGNLTLKILNILEFISDDIFNIRIILGPEFKNDFSINKLMKGSRHRIEILRNVEDMSGSIKWCDLAISAAGSTVWEMTIFDTPLMLFPQALNQKLIADELDTKKMACSLNYEGTDIQIINALFREKFTKLIKNDFERVFISKNIGTLIDKKYIGNFIKEIF
jgi:UDP-2,4-diacetamido-2,4,6-trideoxy-beta-L-altropyranose hydrolase